MASFQGPTRVAKSSAESKKSTNGRTRKKPILLKKPSVPASIGPSAVVPGPNLMGGGPGAPLSTPIQNQLEKSYNVNLNGVRVHQDESTKHAARSMKSRAFTYGSHVYLGPNENPADISLMGHEVAHTVQQQNVSSVQQWGSGPGDMHEHEAHRASQAAAAGRAFSIQSRVSAPRVQHLGLSDILGGLADLAALLPGFTLLTVILGRNPITMKVVDRNFSNLLRGFMGLIAGVGEILFQILNKYGIIDKMGAWVSDQMIALGLTYDDMRNRFTKFTDTLKWSDIFSPGDVWNRAKTIFQEPIDRIKAFISRLISQAITWLKETFMQPLSSFCQSIPGFKLITILLGKDPFTNTPVPRTAMNVVSAFAEFIPGGSEKVQQLQESKALEKAYAWFIDETKSRNLTWDRVAGTFGGVWNTLKLEDVLSPIETIKRIGTMFAPLFNDLISFAKAALIKLLEIIYEAVMGAGGARILAIVKKGRDSFMTIIRNPVGFLSNLLAAVGQGVRQFMGNILTHLKEGVIAWLTGPVAKSGIKMPAHWDLKGIIWFVLQILGLTYDRIRQKLVNLIGAPAMNTIEKGFALIQEIREKGIVQALKDRVSEFFGALKEAALGSIRNYLQMRLVVAGITQLISMLNPVGAVIQAIIKTYTTIKFFLDKINQILDFVESIVNSIASIAAGAIGSAANFIEKTMARTIPFILDFLARFIGLGDVGAQVQKTIKSLQGKVDGMLDKVVGWIKKAAGNLLSKALGGDPKTPAGDRLRKAIAEAVPKVNKYAGKKVGALILRPLLFPIKAKYQLTKLDVIPKSGTWHIHAAINPEAEMPTGAKVETDQNAPVKVGDVEVTPTVTYTSTSMKISKGSSTVGIGMTAEYLAPNHPQGSSPGASEQEGIFKYLPTDGKIPEGSSKQGGAVYIKGHLLNDNLGGPGVAKNMFPISKQANSDHKNKIEKIAKDIVNNQMLLAFYRVVVTPGTPKEIPGLISKEGDQLYQLDATFNCEFDTYKKADEKKLVRMNSPQSVTITSSYTGATARGKSGELMGTLKTDDAAKVKYKKEDVLWAPSAKK